MTGPFRRLIARAATLLGGSAAALGASLLQTMLIARALGPEEFGTWAGLQAFGSVAAALVTFRTSEPVTRYLVEFRQQAAPERVRLLLGTAIAVDAATQLLAVLAVAVLGPRLAGHLAGGEAAAALYPLVGLALVRSLFDHCWFSVARDLGRYRAIAILNGTFPLLRLIATAALWLAGGLSLPALAILFAALGVLQLLITGANLGRALAAGYGIALGGLFRRDLLARQRELAPFWSFMKATFLWSLFTGLVKEGDVLILGSLRPAGEVGWYRLAKSLAGTAQQVADLLAQVIYQDFSELVVARDRAGLGQRTALLARTWLPLVAAGALVAALLADPILPLLFGVAYQPAAEVFRILLAGSAVVSGLFWVRPLALAYELHWFNLRVVVIGSLLFVPLDVALIGLAGVDGAAAAFAVIAAAGPLALLVPVLRRLHPGRGR